jgi:hypothetical protein
MPESSPPTPPPIKTKMPFIARLGIYAICVFIFLLIVFGPIVYNAIRIIYDK